MKAPWQKIGIEKVGMEMYERLSVFAIAQNLLFFQNLLGGQKDEYFQTRWISFH